ncbi:ROK family protein [Actinokineospora sp. NPDC004072]
MTSASAPGVRPAAGVAAVLRTALRHGPLPRRTLARMAGMSGASVTRHCERLLAAGLLREVEPPAARRVGRPHVPVAVQPAAREVIGIHLAHEFATVAVSDLAGRIVRQRRVAYRGGAAEQDVDAVARVAAEWVDPRRTHSVGVATGGWVDADAGALVRHPSLGWRGVPLREIIARHIPLPVHVDNHTRGLVVAEELLGRVDPDASVLHLFVGNVVDVAVRTGRTVHRGPRSAAGGIAHLPVGDPEVRCPLGHLGCFEATVSDQAWARRVAGRSFWELLAAAEAGDAAARALFVERARVVGRAAALLFDLVNPDVLIVAELGAVSMPECMAAVRAEVAARSHACASPEIAVRASGFEATAILGMSAAGIALDALYRDPLDESHGLDGN